MRICWVGLFAITIFTVFFTLSVNSSPIASKSYVDSIIAGLANVQSDWNQTDSAANDYIKNKPVLATIATTGSYNDLKDLPPGALGTPGALYSVQTNGLFGAATNDSFYVDMDGLRFKATKQSTTNYWAVRLVNNTPTPITIGSTWLQLYGAAQVRSAESVNMAVGAEFNPDAETGDLGYGKEDTAVVHIFDTTNRHLYRWTVTVYVANAVIVVEKLY